MVDARYDWNDEAVAKLKLCIDNKLTSTSTAVLLGVSRNVVIGKAARLGLAFASGSRHNTARTIAVEETLALPTPFATLPSVPVFEDEEYLLTPAEDEPTPSADGVSIHDLRSGHCRAIIGGDSWASETIRYCGEPIADSKGGFSFCAAHASLYLTTPAKERARLRAEAE